MEIQADFSEVATLAPGTYKARLTKCENLVSKKGGQYLKWTLETFGSDDAKNNNKKVFHNTMTSGPGAGGLKRLLAATVGPVDGSFDTDALLGKEVSITVVQGTDQHGNVSDFPEVKAVAKLTE